MNNTSKTVHVLQINLSGDSIKETGIFVGDDPSSHVNPFELAGQSLKKEDQEVLQGEKN